MIPASVRTAEDRALYASACMDAVREALMPHTPHPSPMMIFATVALAALLVADGMETDNATIAAAGAVARLSRVPS